MHAALESRTNEIYQHLVAGDEAACRRYINQIRSEDGVSVLTVCEQLTEAFHSIGDAWACSEILIRSIDYDSNSSFSAKKGELIGFASCAVDKPLPTNFARGSATLLLSVTCANSRRSHTFHRCTSHGNESDGQDRCKVGRLLPVTHAGDSRIPRTQSADCQT